MLINSQRTSHALTSTGDEEVGNLTKTPFLILRRGHFRTVPGKAQIRQVPCHCWWRGKVAPPDEPLSLPFSLLLLNLD